MLPQDIYIKGQGAQSKPKNVFLKHEYIVTEDDIKNLNFNNEDEGVFASEKTHFYIENPKKIVNKVDSPDLGLMYSMNPYQGCEHGCIYCYARNSHQYWGFSAGIDFERRILIKENAPELLRKQLDHPKWKPHPIMLSGNTDCYQPIERKMKITRRLLEIFLEYKHPVGLITKNSLVLRDIDILEELAKLNLVHATVSITSLNEKLRLKLEPRTATAKQRLKVVEELSKKGIPVNVNIAPIIPSLNDHEIPNIVKAVADNGALSAAYIIVRLNGEIGAIFENWVRKAFPDSANKILDQIAQCHGGKLNDSRWGTRMKGEGVVASTINKLFKLAYNKYMADRIFPEYDLTIFKRPERGQLSLF